MSGARTLGSAVPFLLSLAALFPVSPATSAEGLLGVQAVEGQKVYELGEVPVTLLLSKSNYRAEDLHLDAIVWLRAPGATALNGELRVSLHDENGATLARDAIRPPPGDRVFFSLPFPPAMLSPLGGRGYQVREDQAAYSVDLIPIAISIPKKEDPQKRMHWTLILRASDP